MRTKNQTRDLWSNASWYMLAGVGRISLPKRVRFKLSRNSAGVIERLTYEKRPTDRLCRVANTSLQRPGLLFAVFVPFGLAIVSLLANMARQFDSSCDIEGNCQHVPQRLHRPGAKTLHTLSFLDLFLHLAGCSHLLRRIPQALHAHSMYVYARAPFMETGSLYHF